MENTQLLPAPAVDIPLDKRWNTERLKQEIAKGLLGGEPIPDIADRLQKVTGMGYHAAIRNARTATTGAQNAGRVHRYQQAQRMGIQLQKKWLATLDNRTRHEHRMLDGEICPVGGKFRVEGMEIEYPGDPKAPGRLVYNCRCTLISEIEGVDNAVKNRYSKLNGQGYEEWKHELAPKNDVASGKSAGIIKLKELFFQTFYSGEDANNFFYYDGDERGFFKKKNSEHGKWKSGLTKDEETSIRDYTANAYADLNKYLRRKDGFEKLNADRQEYLAKNIDSAIERFVLKDNIIVQRGVDDLYASSIIGVDGFDSPGELIGKTFFDAGFGSATAMNGNKVASAKPFLFEIEVPSGKGRGAYINSLSGQFEDVEFEFLLARDSSFIITDVIENSETIPTQTILKMRMVENGA